MFRGPHKVTLDAKGRLAMPARYRDQIIEEAEGRLVATVDLNDRCLLIYTSSAWEEIERKLMRLPTLDPNARRLQRLMIGHAMESELDSHGRLLISPKLREYAGIDKDAMLIGQGNRFELWDEAHWEAQREIWLKAATSEELPAELKSLSF
jgi:MraZ protein